MTKDQLRKEIRDMIQYCMFSDPAAGLDLFSKSDRDHWRKLVDAKTDYLIGRIEQCERER